MMLLFSVADNSQYKKRLDTLVMTSVVDNAQILVLILNQHRFL